MSILNDKETSIESTTKILDMVGGTTGLRRNTHNSITAILLLTGVLAVGGCTKENTHAQPNSPTSPLSSENEMKTQGKKSHIDDTQDTSTHRLTKKQTQHLDARISETERTM